MIHSAFLCVHIFNYFFAILTATDIITKIASPLKEDIHNMDNTHFLSN